MIATENLDLMVLIREELADIETLLGSVLPTTSFESLKETRFLLEEAKQVLEEAVEL